MELEVEELDRLKRKLLITVPEDVVCERVNKAYRELNRQMKMPGFRSGKIPQSILEKQVPIQSFTEMFQQMMQEYYERALQESGIKPAGQPEIENTQLENIKKDAPFKFSVILDVKPEITVDVKGYKGLKVKKKEAVVSDKELDKAIDGILKKYGHLEHHEDGHEIGEDDFVIMDFEGFFEGEPLESGKAENYTIQVGSKKMIEGFEAQLVGHQLGEEFEVKLPLPANWGNKVRRVSLPVPGKEGAEDLATFQVKIKEVKKQVLPELGEDIAADEGFDSVDKFRRAVKADLQMHKEQQEELRIKEDIFNKLVKETKVEPPDSLVKRELKFMIEGMKYQIEHSGMKVEDSGFDEERAENEWREKAEFNTKGYLILEAIAGKENIHVTHDDLEEEYKKLAEQVKKKPEEIKAGMMNNPESMSQTTSKLLGLKTMNFLFSHCEFEYVKDQPEASGKSSAGKT